MSPLRISAIKSCLFKAEKKEAQSGVLEKNDALDRGMLSLWVCVSHLDLLQG
ncbi:hypothetical protein ACRRTK_004439 [Alexandromys fortis]